MPQQFSFDVFDTAVTRLVLEPNHLHWSVGKRLFDEGIIGLSADEWRGIRCAAEERVRALHAHNEATFDEIYRQIAKELGLTDVETQRAMRVEWSEEQRLVRPIASTRTRIRSLVDQGESPWFISDTYFNRKQIGHLLRACGYSNNDQHIYASCEHQQSKAKGDLYVSVAALNNLACADIHHFGDNFVSDVERANDNGYGAEAFLESRVKERERLLYSASLPGFIGSAIAGSARAARLEYEGAAHRGIVTAATTVAGPLLTAYVLWLLLDCIERGGRTLFFLARDGQILKRICDRLIAWLGVKIETRYLYASRRAFFLGALPRNIEDAVPFALEESKNETLEGALKSLGLRDEEMLAVAEAANLQLSDRLDHMSPGHLTVLSQILLSDLYAHALANRMTDARAATLRYFEQEGLLNEETAYIVDLGWRGNLQRRMQRIIETRTTLIGYYICLHTTPKELEGRTHTWTQESWPREANLETFALADHTSVHGFAIAANGDAFCAPLIAESSELIEWGVREQQSLIDVFVRNLLHAVDADSFSPRILADALQTAAVAAFSHFWQAPSKDEATAYGGIEHSGDQNHLHSRELAPALSNLDAIWMFLDAKRRHRRTTWFYASMTRSSDKIGPKAISAFYRLIVRLKTDPSLVRKLQPAVFIKAIRSGRWRSVLRSS